MELNELPDLSDWRFVEVLTIEEAAMLWGGIDPAEWQVSDIGLLKNSVHTKQYRKAWIARKAFTEAVCAGTLPFVDAWERHEDWQNGPYEIRVEFPSLPTASRLITHMTRINQAALLKWAKGKLPSIRAEIRAEISTQNTEPLLIENKIRGRTGEKIYRALSRFPDEFPSYSENPPPLDKKLRPWLLKELECDAREQHVLGKLVSEHFGLKKPT
ncbi:MAG TPA: hypothetical protein VJ642_08205 [Chromobacteriaceae bacterium]|nr:hypothetical protein [Chromobacteriaceae bacterium]